MYGLGMADGIADRASAHVGIEVTDARPGHAVTVMTVADHHCNGHGVCHGGFIFTLADSAMAFATNSEEHQAVATSAEIDFIEAARVGDVLTATCHRIVERGKAGISDAVVTNQEGLTVAVFRGRTLGVRMPADKAPK